PVDPVIVQDVIYFPTIADAWIREASGNTNNFGRDQKIHLAKRDSDSRMKASGLIKFDMEELESLPKSSEISKAELVLRILKTQGEPITDVYVTDSPWEEMTVNGTTSIELGEKIGTWEAEEQFGIMTMDITDFLERNPDRKMLSFYLTIENSDGSTADEVHVQYYTKDQF
ncbi:DNRLRE domain-containing protein, partial [uncultured Vibrio sp.]|uniref:CBM96 family carbohydrate-binding protein n=1 Tax=uncultured Vibrio sp. TaxID=114054 RepID=UPI0026337FED